MLRIVAYDPPVPPNPPQGLRTTSKLHVLRAVVVVVAAFAVNALALRLATTGFIAVAVAVAVAGFALTAIFARNAGTAAQRDGIAFAESFTLGLAVGDTALPAREPWVLWCLAAAATMYAVRVAFQRLQPRSADSSAGRPST